MENVAQKEVAAKFTQGSIMKHVVVMTATGAIGLLSVFLVDAVNLFYISRLGQQELAAAIGFSSSILFFNLSIAIGCMIAAASVTAKKLGAGDKQAAKQYAAASIVFMFLVGIVIAVVMLSLLEQMLDWIGAEGETKKASLSYMRIIIPSFPLFSVGMCLSGLLRAFGDAKRSMYVTLSIGVISLIIDPILIFGFDLGLEGAAIALVIVRIIMVILGLYFARTHHDMLCMPSSNILREAIMPFVTIATPAILTQIATPIGNAYMTSAISTFGDDAVAGWAIIGRVIPLAFGAVFSLSSAIGPILSQNYGAKRYDRVQCTMTDALKFSLIYCFFMWAVLAIFNQQIVTIFSANSDAVKLIQYFCYFIAGAFIFNGALFVSNAAFNNLGFPFYATLFNWGRATLGTIPFVYFGMNWGAEGVLAGWAMGGVIFGTLSIIVCFKAIKTLPQRDAAAHDEVIHHPESNSAFSSRTAGN